MGASAAGGECTKWMRPWSRSSIIKLVSVCLDWVRLGYLSSVSQTACSHSCEFLLLAFVSAGSNSQFYCPGMGAQVPIATTSQNMLLLRKNPSPMQESPPMLPINILKTVPYSHIKIKISGVYPRPSNLTSANHSLSSTGIDGRVLVLRRQLVGATEYVYDTTAVNFEITLLFSRVCYSYFGLFLLLEL